MWPDQVDVLFNGRESTIARDLKMNLKSLAENSSLSASEYGLIALAVASAKKLGSLREIAITELLAEKVAHETLNEAIEAPGIMGLLNTYYKFKKFMKTSNPAAESDYGPAKLRMQSLASPKMGKETFELVSLALSLVNGCEQCVVAHEEALRKLNVPADKIHDVIRLTASLFGATQLLQNTPS